MKTLTRDEIFAIDDHVMEEVLIPEWGEDAGVFVKGMSGRERDLFEGSLVVERGKNRKVNMDNFRAKLASLTCCDENGTRIFQESDVRKLTEKSSAALQRIFVVAQRLSGINQESIDELTEGLEDDPFADSPSD